MGSDNADMPFEDDGVAMNDTHEYSLLEAKETVTAIQRHNPAGRTEFSADQVELIKRLYGGGATNDEFAVFLHQCKRTGLDPMARQIYLVRRWDSKNNRNNMTVQVGIDGFRLVADRTGCYAGNDDPVYDDESNPRRATVTVYKIVGGLRCPFTATARWDQYYPGDKQGFMWKKMPHLMLGKCAEALALRKAFPAELSGLYTDDEMAQAGDSERVSASTQTPVAVLVTDEEVRTLQKLILDTKTDLKKFLVWGGGDAGPLKKLSDLPRSMYAKAIAAFNDKLKPKVTK